MVRNTVMTKSINSSFLSCDKDAETILRKLFVESKPYSEQLKRLLVINTKDCLDNTSSEVYTKKLGDMSVARMRDMGYIKLEPKIRLPEFEEVKSYMYLSFDDFTPNAKNPAYRDCNINFDILCNIDYWDIGDYRCRPLKICGYIDGILNNSRLSGIGTVQFLGASQLILDENIAGYTLMYRAIHGHDDMIAAEG